MLYFKKSQTAPKCLAEEAKKKNGTWRCDGVARQLNIDFKGKCYICERKAVKINIEHFMPISRYETLKLSWDNLFYACAHCNGIKHNNPTFDDILNCTVESDDVESKLRYWINPYPGEKVEITVLDNTSTVQNTQELILRVFNGKTELQEIGADRLTQALLDEIHAFQLELIGYFKDTADDEDRAHHRKKIKQELHPASSFTSFKRSIIRANPRLLSEFGEYLLQ